MPIVNVYKEKELLNAYIGEYVNYKTFTISWTEQSDMSSGWTYSDDATGLTAGSTAFDEFFGYSAVRLNTSGVETAEVTQTTPGQLNLSQLGTLTSGDNVMIKFPLRGIKMSKSGSTVTLSITDEQNKDGYQYYAFQTGTLSNPGTPKSAFYLGAYKACNNGSNVLKSWSGQSPEVSQTQATLCSRASANGSGYNIIGYYQRMYINALYMMKYGNPNCKTVVGTGHSSSSAKVNTGGTNSQTNATYGTNDRTTQCKLFGLEDWRGNVNEYIGGVYTDASKYLYVTLSGYSGTLSGGENTGSTVNVGSSGGNISSIVGDNKAMFAANNVVSNTSYNTYYCNLADIGASKLMASGGNWQAANASGSLRVHINFNTNNAFNSMGSRLLYL